jgi:DNA-binding MarR family transcriptional regulator
VSNGGVAQAERSTGDLAAALRLFVGRLARRLRQQSGADLTASQLSALASIERLGPLPLGGLARVEQIAPPTLTNLVGRLEERGLVRRRPDRTDRRSALVEVTAAGRRALADVRSAKVAFLVERLDRLTEEERADLVAALPLLERLLEDDR